MFLRAAKRPSIFTSPSSPLSPMTGPRHATPPHQPKTAKLPSMSPRQHSAFSSAYSCKASEMIKIKPNIPLGQISLDPDIAVTHSRVFRGDEIPPQTVKSSDGFKAGNKNTSLVAHIDKFHKDTSGHKATSRSLVEAVYFAEKTNSPTKYVYAIKPTLYVSGIDDLIGIFKLDRSLMSEEAEYPVYNLIPWHNVVGYKAYTRSFEGTAWEENPDYKEIDYCIGHETANSEESEQFKKNRAASGWTYRLPSYEDAKMMALALEMESKLFGGPNIHSTLVFDKIEEQDLMAVTKKPKGSEYNKSDWLFFATKTYQRVRIEIGDKLVKKDYYSPTSCS